MAAVQRWQGDGKPVIKELRFIVEDGLEETILMDPVHGISLETAENRHC